MGHDLDLGVMCPRVMGHDLDLGCDVYAMRGVSPRFAVDGRR